MDDRGALNDLFDYTTFTWEAYGRSVATLPPDAITRPLSDGWPALRNVLFHIAGGWDGWLRDELGVEDPLDAEPESITSWEDVQELRQKVRGWMRRVIDQTSDDDLRTPAQPVWDDSPAAMQVSKGDVLTHILLHERGHHGDVSTALAQLGTEPPNIDYLVYVWFRSRKAR